ncbi:MAG: cytochrome c biogenesis CcdA family protein, partial [Candidatus Methylomirabilia bacterium]
VSVFELVVVPFFFGLVGFVTPCSLAVNLIFLGYIRGKPRGTRLAQASAFVLVRALILMGLGLAFASVGQAIVSFQFAYRPIIAGLFVVLGILFLVSRYRPFFMPSTGFVRTFGRGKSSAVVMGTLFGLDIPACSSPLLIALLGNTVLKGEMLFGAVSLLVFGVGISLPLVVVSAFEGASRFLDRAAQASSPLAYAGGFLLIALGLAAFSPRAMAAAGIFFQVVAGLFA